MHVTVGVLALLPLPVFGPLFHSAHPTVQTSFYANGNNETNE
jgi:hypothetical protein